MPQKLPSPNPTCIGGEQYSALQFTYDERLLCHLVSNEIHVYDTNDIASSSASASSSCPITFKVRRPNLSSFTLAPKNMTSTSTNATEYLLSTFIPEVKGKPAQVALHKLSVEQPNESSSSSNNNNNNNNNNNKSMKESILTSKSFFQTESVTVKWSPLGNSALILAQTTVDATGESYYGSSMLHLLLSHPKPDNIQVQLPGKGNGVVHDVAWCPVPSVQYTATAAAAPNDTNNINIPTPCFALISGKMPAMGSLHYGTTGDASFLFGEAHRNVVSWSPHGRFLCLAGFGNLAGGMDFWDRNKLKKMPRFHPGQSNPLQDEIRAPCAVGYGWSPDSRTFFVSTTSPRMNVDNSIALFKYNGYGPFDQHQLAVAWDNQSYLPNKLHSVEFVPTPAYTYSDRSQSPPPKKRKDGQDMDPSISNAILPSTSSSNRSKNSTTSSASKPTPSVGRYIPPSARGKAGTGTGGNSLAERMRREREGSTAQAGKVTKGGVSSSSSTVSTFGTTNAPPTKSKNAIRREKQRLAKLKAKEEEEKAVAAAAQEAAKAKEAASIVTVDPEKRAKKIKKLLKQIDDLKLKNPGDLNDDQRKKLLNEDDLRKELANLAI